VVKTYNIFRKIDDIDEFEEYFFETILPLIFKTRNKQVKVTKVIPMTPSQGVEGIQYIVDSYFDSLEAIDQTVHSKEGHELMEKTKDMPGELSVFIATEKFIPSTDAHRFKEED